MSAPGRNIKPIRFGSRLIGPEAPVVVIAEIGINHEGDVEACARMIRQAANAGADVVKLQTMDPRENYVPGTLSHELFSKAELTCEETARMFDLARSLGMEALTTCGDLATLTWVDRLEPAAHKISSGLLTHLPLIDWAARLGRPLLMSTGMTGLAPVREAVDQARGAGATEIVLLQCTSRYPAPPETLHLRAIRTLADEFAVPAGFSDHSVGHEAAVLAVAGGACVIEKHFSENPNRPSFDHHISLDEAGLKTLVGAVRKAEIMLGTQRKDCSPEVQSAAKGFLRSIVARRDIEPGETLDLENVAFMRTVPERRGLPPGEWVNLAGRRTVVRIARFEAIQPENVH